MQRLAAARGSDAPQKRAHIICKRRRDDNVLLNAFVNTRPTMTGRYYRCWLVLFFSFPLFLSSSSLPLAVFSYVPLNLHYLTLPILDDQLPRLEVCILPKPPCVCQNYIWKRRFRVLFKIEKPSRRNAESSN